MKRRPFALLCAFFALSSAYCNRTIGGDVDDMSTPSPDGSPCNNDVECASYSCDSSGVCVAPPDGLVEVGGDCSGGRACVGDATCEGDLCVANGMSCAPDGTPCEIDNDCCTGVCGSSGMCGLNATGGAGGAANCSGQGDPCSSDADCCVGGCVAGASTCSDTCEPMQSTCTSNTDCCSGNCDMSALLCI
jgi:hypothetical protein